MYIRFCGVIIGGIVSGLAWIVACIVAFPLALTGLFIMFDKGWIAPLALGCINGALMGKFADAPGKGVVWGMVVGVIVGPTVAFSVTEMLTKAYSLQGFFLELVGYMIFLGLPSIVAGAMSSLVAVKFYKRLIH